jgi:hypothetical protein
MVKRVKITVTPSMILRSVASSSAIETNETVKSIEKRILTCSGKFSHLKLAK